MRHLLLVAAVLSFLLPLAACSSEPVPVKIIPEKEQYQMLPEIPVPAEPKP
ncbi:MAG: hypothetical protein HYS13_25735 [Planctomycetia bacterium]|nr:hypothetical protein [Planctomycetia bacterium]